LKADFRVVVPAAALAVAQVVGLAAVRVVAQGAALAVVLAVVPKRWETALRRLCFARRSTAIVPPAWTLPRPRSGP
jgi:hypothetical protein